jgi:26S proteasome regulatory subunit N5
VILFKLGNYDFWQIYVELERARLVRRLAKIKEDQGLIAEAAELMQEIAVCYLLHVEEF